MPDSRRIFQDILKLKTSSPLAVFDLDSTLYNVSHRTQKILEAFSNEPDVKKQFPFETETLRQVKIEIRDWGLKEPLLRIGLSASAEFHKAIHKYWIKYFFSNNFLHVDTPFEGAVEYVNALSQDGVQIIYLTGRDEPNMKQGTLESLSTWGFPLKEPQRELIMKPAKGLLEDEDYKASRIRDLKKLTPHIWFFENEPLIINKVLTSSPEVQMVWVDTTHSGRAEPPKGLPTIRTKWSR